MPLLCSACPFLPQGTGDVLAELAAQAAASLQQGFSFDGNHTGATAGPAGGQHTSISISFDRIAPCLLPEQKQVGRGLNRGWEFRQQVLALLCPWEPLRPDQAADGSLPLGCSLWPCSSHLLHPFLTCASPRWRRCV